MYHAASSERVAFAVIFVGCRRYLLSREERLVVVHYGVGAARIFGNIGIGDRIFRVTALGCRAAFGSRCSSRSCVFAASRGRSGRDTGGIVSVARRHTARRQCEAYQSRHDKAEGLHADFRFFQGKITVLKLCLIFILLR